MGFIDFLAEAMDNTEVEEEFDPSEIELGMKEEKEHKDLYEIFKKCAEDNQIEMPVSEDDFFLTIVKAHLRENENYYSILIDAMKPKDVVQESYETGVTYDSNKMTSVIDGFVRFLIGTPKIALTNLSEYQSGIVSGLIPLTKKDDQYSKLWNDLYDGFFNVVKKYL